MTKVSILGSTGTIGRNALEVIRRHARHFRVTALAGGTNVRLLAEQVREFRPRLVSVGRKEDADVLRTEFARSGVRVVQGAEGAEIVGSDPKADLVLSAITGISGLKPTLAAVRAGKRVALANKESLVVAGALLKKEARASGAVIIPVDSEHSAVFQCLAGEDRRNVKKVTLTASGGPFFRIPLAELKTKTVRETLNHPRWKMGKKVTVDSATLMNKGLELIEARWLFDLAPRELAVLIHPQSIVHALVEMRDGSVLAQLGPTDMKVPIQVALTYPERLDAVLPPLDLARVRSLEFYPVDFRRFPMLRLALWALEEQESAPVALNAANEAAVEAFLGGRIRFPDIYDVVRRTVARHRPRRVGGLDDILDVDGQARALALKNIAQRT
jgi:1-deoxy-D-xylulose-5-phosphate reductoisomerase